MKVLLAPQVVEFVRRLPPERSSDFGEPSWTRLDLVATSNH